MTSSPVGRRSAAGLGGQAGDYRAEQAERFDAGVAGHQKHLLAAAAIEPASRVLDIGCGSGRTTRDAALVVDLSARQLALARRLASVEGLANVTFEQADAQNHPSPAGSFDIAVSRHGVMFFADPSAAFRNIALAVRPGGRMASLVWRSLDRNEWIGSFFRALFVGHEVPVPPPDAPGPFRRADPGGVRDLPAAAGFADVRLTELAKPMYFGAGVAYDSACWLVEARRPPARPHQAVWGFAHRPQSCFGSGTAAHSPSVTQFIFDLDQTSMR